MTVSETGSEDQADAPDGSGQTHREMNPSAGDGYVYLQPAGDQPTRRLSPLEQLAGVRDLGEGFRGLIHPWAFKVTDDVFQRFDRAFARAANHRDDGQAVATLVAVARELDERGLLTRNEADAMVRAGFQYEPQRLS